VGGAGWIALFAYERQGALALAAQEFEAAIALDSNWSLPRTRLTQLCQRLSRSNDSHRAGKEDRCDVWLGESIPKIAKGN
jgi:hypothetical protein